MPTDLTSDLTRNSETAAQTQTHVTFVMVYVIVCLVAIVLLFMDQSYAAAVEWMGLN
jgi:hypothetical protein